MLECSLKTTKKMMKFGCYLTVIGMYLIAFGIGVNSANILACISSASRSHHIIETTILEELAIRGHNVSQLKYRLFPFVKFFSVFNTKFNDYFNSGDCFEYVSSGTE